MDTFDSNSSKFNEKMLSLDRIIVLGKMEGKHTLNSSGLVEKGLFDGTNRLHAVRDPQGLWMMKYDNGALPGGLKHKFTNFNSLKKHVEDYFKKRNIEIKEVIA